MQRFRFNPITIACLLAGSIQTVPLLAEAAAGRQVADGVHLDVAAGDYATTSDDQHALHALNGGSIDTIDAKVGTSGNGAAAAWAEHGTSQINFEGGSLSTSGFGAVGAVVKAGATINIERDSAGNGTVIHTTGDNSAALVADGGGAINITGATLITEGSNVLDGVYGAVIAKGASVVTIIDSTIETTGDNAHGIVAAVDSTINATNVQVSTSGSNARGALANGAGSTLNINGGSFSTTGVSSDGVSALNGGHVVIGIDDRTGLGTTIHTTGKGAVALRAHNATMEVTGATIKTEGDRTLNTGAAGIAASGGGSVKVVDSTIETSGQMGNGIDVGGPGSAVQMSGGSILTKGNDGRGVVTYQGGSAWLNDVEIRTEGEAAHGAITNGGNIELANTHINTSGQGAKGLYVIGNGHISVGSGSTLHTTGDKATAAHADKGTMVLNSSYLLTEGNRVDDISSAGVLASNGGTIQVIDSQIKTTGYWGDGMSAVGAGSLIDMTGGSILTTGQDSKGVVAYGGNNTVNLNGVEVRTEGESARGVVASGFASDVASSVNLTGSRVTTTGLGSFGLQALSGGVVNATNSGILTTGENATGVSVLNDMFSSSTVNLKDSNVRTEGFGAWGADVNGTLNVDGGSLVSAQHGALMASGDSTINLSNGAKVIGGNGTLLSISDEASLVAFGLDNQVYAEGDIVFGPDADSDANGALDSNTNVSLSNASHWKGKTDAIDTLSLSQDSQWTVTGDSTVGQLSLNQSRVVFDAPDAGTFKTLSVNGDLSGNGSFLLNTDLSSVQGDLLKVAGQIEGEHTLIVADSGREAQGEALMLVDGNGGAGKFDLYGGKVDAGAFRYELEQRGDDWYLAGKESITHPEPENLSKGSNAAVAQHAASAALIGAQMNTLVKRLGELRMGKDDGGLWTRGFSKEQHIDTGSSRAFQQQVNGFEIGADKAIPFYNGKLYLGGMVGKGEARQTFGEGTKGTIDSAMLGSYATYVDHSGVYVDSVLKYTHLDNKVDIASNIGEKVDAKYKNHAVAVDVEVGKQIDLGKGWFVEPQLEVQAFRVSSGDYTASNGLKVEQDAVTSVQSRVGSLFGRNLKLDNGMTVQPYAKASWLTEHSGDSNVKVNGTRLDSKLPGSRAEIGGGVILQTAEKHKFYIDAEYSKGDGIEQPYAVNVGYRYMW